MPAEMLRAAVELEVLALITRGIARSRASSSLRL
jgi:hypothetical protein